MALKAVVENIEDVEEAHRSEYVEKEIGGKKVHVLDIVDIRTHPETQALKNALDRVRQEKTTVEGELSALKLKTEGLPEDFDPAEFQRMKHEEEERQKNPNNADAQLQSQKQMYEQRLTNAEKKRQDDLAKKDEEIRKLNGIIERRVVDDELTKALVEQGVQGPLLRAATAMHRGNIKTKKDPDTGEVEAFFETDLGPEPVGKFLENWSKSDEGKAFVPKPAGGGAGGSQGDKRGTTDNPWKTGNLTAQGLAIRADPRKAEQLIRSAGLKPEELNRELAKLPGRSAQAA